MNDNLSKFQKLGFRFWLRTQQKIAELFCISREELGVGFQLDKKDLVYKQPRCDGITQFAKRKGWSVLDNF